jgi:hypothetical protein
MFSRATISFSITSELRKANDTDAVTVQAQTSVVILGTEYFIIKTGVAGSNENRGKQKYRKCAYFSPHVCLSVCLWHLLPAWLNITNRIQIHEISWNILQSFTELHLHISLLHQTRLQHVQVLSAEVIGLQRIKQLLSLSRLPWLIGLFAVFSQVPGTTVHHRRWEIPN